MDRLLHQRVGSEVAGPASTVDDLLGMVRRSAAVEEYWKLRDKGVSREQALKKIGVLGNQRIEFSRDLVELLLANKMSGTMIWRTYPEARPFMTSEDFHHKDK